MDGMFQLLAEHRFAELFREELGWDRSSGTVAIDVDGRHLEFEAVAQKRGLQVLQCTADRRVLFNRGLLRRTQRLITRTIHEHILIYSCVSPPKQVWQWALRMPDGRELRHREHPFFSDSPPTSLQDRLKGLRFTLDEEQDVSLVDAIHRVREVLDVSPELDLFARRPWYAERSDDLAVAMKRGDEASFHALILLHRPLARHISKRLQRAFGMDLEDAEQIGILGLIRAAKRFDPEWGIQFSTYASLWIHQACQRYGPDAALLIRLPAHVADLVLPRYRRVQKIELEFGPERANEERERICSADPKIAASWKRVEKSLCLRSLSDRNEPAYGEARSLTTATENEPIQQQIDRELRENVRAAMSFLNERQRRVLMRRYGLEGDACTLEEIAQREGITRERVRQIQVVAERKLRRVIERELKDVIPTGPSTGTSLRTQELAEPMESGGNSLDTMLSSGVPVLAEEQLQLAGLEIECDQETPNHVADAVGR